MSIGLGNEYMFSKLQQNSGDSKAEKLQGKLSGINGKETSDEEMMEVCKEFEAYLVEQVMKRMKDAMTDSEEEENEYLSYFGDMMYQEYANQIAKNGELGLAQQLYESMKRNTVVPTQEMSAGQKAEQQEERDATAAIETEI